MEVDKAKSELLHFQNLLHDKPGDQNLASQEKNATALLRQLQQKLNSALQEKAKMNWVRFGDDNNAFFYQSIKHIICLIKSCLFALKGGRFLIHLRFIRRFSIFILSCSVLRTKIGFQSILTLFIKAQSFLAIIIRYSISSSPLPRSSILYGAS